MTNRPDNQLEAVKVDEKEGPCNCGAILPTGAAKLDGLFENMPLQKAR